MLSYDFTRDTQRTISAESPSILLDVCYAPATNASHSNIQNECEHLVVVGGPKASDLSMRQQAGSRLGVRRLTGSQPVTAGKPSVAQPGLLPETMSLNTDVFEYSNGFKKPRAG